MYNVYIIKNKIGRLYIGQTNNIQLRLKRHNENKVFSTKNRGPWQLIYTKAFSSRGKAICWERYLKSQKGGDGLKIIFSNSPGSIPR